MSYNVICLNIIGLYKTTDAVSVKRENYVKIGQGEGDTKWNGWDIKLFFIMFCIVFTYCWLV